MNQHFQSKFLLLAAVFALHQPIFSQIFAPPQPLTDWSGKLQVEIFDLDSDGDNDILWLESNQKITWLENLGSDTFGQTHDLAGVSETDKFYLLDFDLDGDSDLLGFAAGKIFWYKNSDEKGNFQFAGDLAAAPASDWWIRDLDSDGDLDLVPNLQADGVAFPKDEFVWFKNLGGGTFEKRATRMRPFGISPDIVFEVVGIFLVDWNLDGSLDMAVMDRRNQMDSWLLIYPNDGFGNFPPRAAEYTLSKSSVTWSPILDRAKTLDINGDHFEDLLLRSRFSTGLQTHYYLDVFAQKKGFFVDNFYTGGANPSVHTWLDDFTVCNLDGIGAPEIVATCGEQLKWYENVFPQQTKKWVAFDTTQFFAFNAPIASGDLDGNGFPDIVCKHFDKMVWFKNQIAGKINSKLSLHFFWDKNENGLREADEPALIAPKIETTPKISTEVSDDGKRIEVVSKSDGKVKIKPLPDAIWKTTTAAPVEFLFGSDTAFSHEFGLAASQNLSNFSVALTSAPTRCGQEVPFWLTVRNTGTTSIGGKIQLLAANFSEFVAADVAPDSLAGGSVFWSFHNLPPTEILEIKLTQKITGTAGSVLKQQVAAALLDSAGVAFLEKTFDFSSVVRCSFDPNDKLVETNPPSSSEFVFSETPLIYTIRFQNTGNDTAFRVKIVDPLPPVFDWSSVKILAASHPHTFSVDEQGQLVFLFENILLPDSTSNPTASQGFVKFEIRARQPFVGEALVSNHAKIYFDGSLPVLTAPARFVLTSSAFVVRVKPACTSLPDPLGDIQVFNANPSFPDDKLIYDWGAGLPQSPNLDGLAAGDYFLKIFEASSGALIFENKATIKAIPYFKPAIATTPTEAGLATGSAKVDDFSGLPAWSDFRWDTDPPQFSQEIKNLPAGTYTCTVTHRDGCLAVLTAVVETKPSTSLEAVGVSKFEILPNPSRDATQILVETSKPTDWTIEVFNAQGMKISSIAPTDFEKMHGCQRRLEGLPIGVYFFRLSARGAFAVKKLLVLSD